jgi:hypothetical protein
MSKNKLLGSILGIVVVAITSCAGKPSSVVVDPETSGATSSAANTGGVPNSAGPIGHCLVGTKPFNIEVYGPDAAKTCSNLSSKFADLGFPNQAVHTYAQGASFVELRPAGNSFGCELTWPMDIGRLNATVFGYSSGDLTGDAGPEAKSVCTKMISLGWKGHMGF